MNATMKPCAPADANPRAPKFSMPAGACDTHAHIFGPASRYPWNPARGYTPPDALPEAYERLHQVLGVARGVLTQPSVYGTDNRCMLDYVSRNLDRMRAVVSIEPSITDREIENLHAAGARGIRVNIADKGGNPFASFADVGRMADRIKALRWHIEFLLHVHEMDEHFADIKRLPVAVAIGHLGYMPTALGAGHPKYQAFLDWVREGRCWVKLTASYRITSLQRTPYVDVAPLAKALIECRPDRIVWGTDWPHPICPIPMPNDGDLLDQLADWIPDTKQRRRVLVENAGELYDFGLE